MSVKHLPARQTQRVKYSDNVVGKEGLISGQSLETAATDIATLKEDVATMKAGTFSSGLSVTGSVETTGSIKADVDLEAVGDVKAGGDIIASGDVSADDISATGDITATGSVKANTLDPTTYNYQGSMSPYLPAGISQAGVPYVACKVLAGVLYFVVETILVNDTESDIGPVQCQFYFVLPSAIRAKIYRRDGTNLTENATAAHLPEMEVCRLPIMVGSEISTASLVSASSEGQVNVQFALTIPAGAKRGVSMRGPLVLV